MASKTQALNDSGSRIAVFSNITASPPDAKVTLVDCETRQVVSVEGITAIKTLRSFLTESIARFEHEPEGEQDG